MMLRRIYAPQLSRPLSFQGAEPARAAAPPYDEALEKFDVIAMPTISLHRDADPRRPMSRSAP